MKKKCNKCKLIKSIIEFNKALKRKSGYQNYCRDCFSSYGKTNRIKIRAKKLEWIENNKEKYLEIHRNWAKKNPEKVRARQLVNTEIKKGNLSRLACEVCGNFLSQAHHYDYSKPLDVWWLCTTHHKLADKGKLILYA